jgi:hypothetical protein|tara:strand:- start:265 stop:390 length:126 start_codon:yes stop_codon:yes gene_type:complete
LLDINTKKDIKKALIPNGRQIIKDPSISSKNKKITPIIIHI